MNQENLIRIGVFYDGNYFYHVSNYYNYDHAKKKRISIYGLHQFIRHKSSIETGTDVRLCQIVDAHYFRGRLSAQEASQRGDALYFDRVFDDILMSEGVTTHYLPLKSFQGKKEEKGIDVWFALEAFELAMYKKFDILVLIAGDGDYKPLVRKLNTLGTKVMVLSWDFEYTSETGKTFSTRTSQDLLEEASFPLAMHDLIDVGLKSKDSLVNNLFVQSDVKVANIISVQKPRIEQKASEIFSLKNGYGFIKFPPNNLFFHFSNLINCDFNDLRVGDKVEFTIEKNDEGQDVAGNVRLMG